MCRHGVRCRVRVVCCVTPSSVCPVLLLSVVCCVLGLSVCVSCVLPIGCCVFIRASMCSFGFVCGLSVVNFWLLVCVHVRVSACWLVVLGYSSLFVSGRLCFLGIEFLTRRRPVVMEW